MNNKSYSMKDISSIVMKNIVLIVILGIIGGGVFFVYAKHKETMLYTAERSLIISHGKNDDKQVKTDLMMVPTYADIVEGKQVADQAYKNLPKKDQHKYSKKEFEEDITAESESNSLVISVKATSTSPIESLKLVNNTVQAAKKELPKIQPGLGRVYAYSKATKEDVKVQKHSSVKKYTLVGVALGILAGMIIAFLISTKKYLL
ncbi:hypothetical protein ACOBMG_07980 [Limosilactobacillus mucosae]|uniref:hypothetical protein n=1 Tax=Limosilactobacillus mucosae TaxID=97478 RepID=UPI003B4360F1